MAIVHEWVSSRAGSEKVFEQMALAFPEADLYALTVEHEVLSDLGRHVRTTPLQRFSFTRRRRDLMLPVMPIAWKCMAVPEYDVVLTSSHAFSRFFRTGRAKHLSYVHAPLRYAWDPGIDGRGASRAVSPVREVLRRADRFSARRVDRFAANSTEVAERIFRYYDRDSRVIYPPVDIDFFSKELPVNKQDYLLGVSRWIPYKRLDLVIRAGEATGMPVVIAGSGPCEQQLVELARRSIVPVDLVREPSDEELRDLYRGAGALVFLADEDFGIIPVEAQAAGTPVVALRRGGALDTVVDGLTGVHVDRLERSEIAHAVERALTLDPQDFGAHVQQFSIPAFRSRLIEWVGSSLGGPLG